jgi:thiol-disulfide isomerase/thioredoxin
MKRYVVHALSVLALLLVGYMPAHAQPEPLPIGSSMPSATLQEAGGTALQLPAAAGEAGTVILFWSNQCPWVERYEGRVVELVNRFQGQGVRFLLVNANDASAFPQESMQAMQQRAANYPAPYVQDGNAQLARALGATRTPHAFVFDQDETLVYTGTIDDSPSGPEGVTSTYLADALSAITGGGEVPTPQTKAFGCTIKFPSS